MGKTDFENPNPYKQQSIMLVPVGTPGVTVERMLSVVGYDEAPHGHAQLRFKDVRVPASNVVLGPGRGFEIMQGRLGPGRIHHTMRAIGAVSILFAAYLTHFSLTRLYAGRKGVGLDANACK
jgi:acyl-CoA dehydrogenase